MPPQVDRDKLRVVVQGGMTLHALHKHLDAHDLAVSNLGSISDQSIAGVISTATHGTGLTFGCLSTQVLSLDMMLADGSRVRCSRNENQELFLATSCGLGATGLIMRVTLQVERAFRLQESHVPFEFDEVVGRLDELFAASEHT